MGNIKVSIVIPIYNVAGYLKECLDSCIKQTLKEIEIICVDDGSTDESYEIVKAYAKKDNRVVPITKKNAGYGNSMNIGMAVAKGDYIGIVEPDDYIESNMFEILYSTAEKYNVDFVKSDYYIFNSKNKKNPVYVEMCTDQSYYGMVLFPHRDRKIFDFFINNWTGIYRTPFIRENNIKHNETPGASYQDNGFWFQVMTLAKSLMFIHKAFYHYRQDNPNSSINNKGKVFCLNEEYGFIHNFVMEHPYVKENFMYEYFIKLFRNYMYTYERIAKEYKLEFLERTSKEMKELQDSGEVDWAGIKDLGKDRMSEWVSNMSMRILDDYKVFYYTDQMWKLNRSLEEAQNRLNRVMTSKEMITGRKYADIIRRILGKKKSANTELIRESNIEADKPEVAHNAKNSITGPLVSVIMPVFNVAKYLKKSLGSIIDQSYKNIEIICINDGSTDYSLDILKRMANGDSRIKIIDQPNGGPARARNAGLDAASGKYVSFVDSDDFIDVNMYETLVNTAEKELADIVVFGGTTWPDKEDAPAWIKYRISPHAAVYEGESIGEVAIFKEPNSVPFLWLQFFRRDLLEQPVKLRMHENMDLGEDQEFLFTIYPHARKIIYTENLFYFYRVEHKDSLMWKYSHIPTDRFRKNLKLVETVLSEWADNGYKDIHGYLATWMTGQLYQDLIGFPKYLKIEFARQIIDIASKYDIHLNMCGEEEYDNAMAIEELAASVEPDEVILQEDIESINSKIESVYESIKEKLHSKTFKLGRLLTIRNRLKISEVLPDEYK